MRNKYIIVDMAYSDENPEVYRCSNLKEVKEELFGIMMSYDFEGDFWNDVKEKNILLYKTNKVDIKKLLGMRKEKFEEEIGWKA